MRWRRPVLVESLLLLASCKGVPPDSRIDRRVEVHLDAGSGDAGAVADGGDGGASECFGPAGSPTAAKPCGCDGDCDRGETCFAETFFGWAGGHCNHLCDVDEDCPDGLSCAFTNPDDPSTGFCVTRCASTTDCRPGYVCQRNSSDPWAPGQLMCLPMCQSDEDCIVTGSCDRYWTACGSILEHPGDGDIGDPCDSDEDCHGGWCGVGARFPGGYCTAGCSYSRQGCPEGASCIKQGSDDQDWGICMASCERRSDCREDEGYTCALDPNMPDYPVCAHP